MSSIAIRTAVPLRHRVAELLGRIDPGLWVALLIALFGVWPFVGRPSLETYTDAEMHVYRALEVEESIRAGVLYPRWAPDLYYGYGYPVFNYYSPLTYHLAAWYSIVTGTDVVAGIKFVLILGYLLGSLGIYLFVRDRWGGMAGAVASAAFILSPYILYIDPHARGDVPEFFAITLFPLLLWAASRLRRSGSPGDAALTAVALALLIFSHPLMSIAFFGLFLLWVAWEMAFGHNVIREDGDRRRRPIALTMGAIGFGLGLAAVLWVPAVLERGAVQLHNVAGPGYFDFHANFLTPAEVFSASPVFDYAATQPRFNFNLGVAQWVLAGLGLLSVFHPRSRRLSVLFFALVAVALVYLMLPSSVQVWEGIPPMSFFQFPSRFLGPAAVVMAVLAAASVGWSGLLPARWVRNTFGMLAIGLCLVSALPHLFPRPWGPFGPVTALRSLLVELDGRAVGTTSGNDFLPSTSDVAPGPIESLLQSYRAGTAPDKVNRATLPPGATVTVASHGPEHDRFDVDAPEGFVLRLYTLYFPGWEAYVNGSEADIEVAKPEGFITVRVPPGESSVEVRFENTPPRWFGWALTWASGIGVLWLLFVRYRRNGEFASPSGQHMPRTSALVLLTGIVVGGIAVTLAGSAGWFHVESKGDDVAGAQYLYHTRLDSNIHFLGFDLPTTTGHPSGEIPVTLYWKAEAEIREDYQVFVHLIGPDGQLWGQSDKLNPADFPTSRWPADRYVRDEHVAVLLPDAPEGEYRLIAGMWGGQGGARLQAWTLNGTPLGDGIELPVRLQVSR